MGTEFSLNPPSRVYRAPLLAQIIFLLYGTGFPLALFVRLIISPPQAEPGRKVVAFIIGSAVFIIGGVVLLRWGYSTVKIQVVDGNVEFLTPLKKRVIPLASIRSVSIQKMSRGSTCLFVSAGPVGITIMDVAAFRMWAMDYRLLQIPGVMGK